MLTTGKQMRVSELLFDLVPKVRGLESVVQSTLQNRIDCAGRDQDRARQQELKQEFELQVTRIRLNLEHLLKREDALFRRAKNGDQAAADTLVTLDEHEARAVELARSLYQRLQSLTC